MIETIRYDLKKDFPQFLFYFLIIASIRFLCTRDFGIDPIIVSRIGMAFPLFLLLSLKLNGTTEHFVTCHDFNQMIPKTSFEIIASNVILTFAYSLITLVILKGLGVSVIFISLVFICFYIFVSWFYIYANYKKRNSGIIHLTYLFSTVFLISLFSIYLKDIVEYITSHSLIVSTSLILLSFIGTFLFSRVMDNKINKEV